MPKGSRKSSAITILAAAVLLGSNVLNPAVVGARESRDPTYLTERQKDSTYYLANHDTKFYFETDAYLNHHKRDQLVPPDDLSAAEDIPSSIASLEANTKTLPVDLLAPTAVIEPTIPDDPIFTVPIVKNKEVDHFLNYFQGTLRPKFGKWLSRSGTYLPMMRKVFREQGLPEDLIYVSLIESGFNPYAYSRSRASGAWQFIYGTGRRYGLKIDTWVDERRDPEKSTLAATKYLKDLYGMFESWPLVMAAYNAGEGRVARAIRGLKTRDFWKLAKSKRYLRKETRQYVPKFMAAAMIAKEPWKYGFDIEYDQEWEFETVTVTAPVDMKVVAKTLGVPYDKLKKLNPELRKSITPPNQPSYILRIPTGKKEILLASLSKMSPAQRMSGKIYKVRKGDTLYGIAKKYQTSVSFLRNMNHLRHRSLLKIGQKLYVPDAKTHARSGSRHSSYKLVKTTKSGKKQIVYKVRKGDSLWEIARDFNVSLKSLRSWNKKLRRRSIIRPGDTLSLFIN